MSERIDWRSEAHGIIARAESRPRQRGDNAPERVMRAVMLREEIEAGLRAAEARGRREAFAEAEALLRARAERLLAIEHRDHGAPALALESAAEAIRALEVTDTVQKEDSRG